MGRKLRIALGVLAGVTVALGAAAIVKRDDLARLANVNALFDESRIVGNFSNMQNLFFSQTVVKSGETFVWPETKRAIAETYSWQGEDKSVADWLTQTDTTSLLVIKNGAVAFEDYYLGTKAEDRRISWSVAKSVMSALFGIAVADGRIKSLDDTVETYVPELKGSAYEGATIRNVLNMASGVAFNEDYLDFWSDINRMGRVLALGGSMDGFAAGITARNRPPGEAWQYVSIDTHVAAMVLRAATGMPLQQFMAENLWSKIGAEDDAVFLTDSVGNAFALGGLNLRTRDYARFGQMMLGFGFFNGRQIIPADWAMQSVEPTSPVKGEHPAGYGYQWWVPKDAFGEFYAIGIYGQFIYINRPARVVIVKTSADRQFTDDGADGALIEAETIEMFRAIAAGLESPA
jgi:CubicO group peptidase (beta-lactamase class C family)